MQISTTGRIDDAGGRPTICGWIILPASVQIKGVLPLNPPQTIISLPVHTAVCPIRPFGALVVLVGLHVLSVHKRSSSEIFGRV